MTNWYMCISSKIHDKIGNSNMPQIQLMFACEITCTVIKPLKQSAVTTWNCSLYVPFVGSIKSPPPTASPL